MAMRPLLARYRSAPLLLGLLILLVLFPFLPGETASSLGFRVVYSGVILAGIYAVSQSRLTVTIALGLALPAIASRWVPDDMGMVGPVTLQLLNIAALLFIASIVFAHVMRRSTYVVDKIGAAITVYLLVGSMFADVYALLELTQPGSLRLGTEPGQVDRDELVYFSFTTLTTLGYGDITPITPRARALTSLEATFGVLYIAVVIAGLVGSSRHAPSPEADHDRDQGG